MATGKNMKVMCDVATFDVKVANLQGKGEPRKVNGKVIKMKTDGSPELTRRNSQGDALGFFNTWQGYAVQTNGRGYYTFDENPDGTKTPKAKADMEVSFYETEDGEFIQGTKNHKTEVFEVVKWEPVKNFTDKYIIAGYYGLIPSQGKSKNDHQRGLNIKANERGMKNLCDYMLQHGVVGRGTLNITSAGFLPTIAYIRPVQIDDMGAWALEVGTFKQQKRFPWVGTAKVEEVVIPETEQVVPSIDEI